MVRGWGIGLLLTFHAALVGWVGCSACPNKTEVAHMGAAAYFWHTLRFDVYCVSPPLTRMMSGLPVALCDPKHNWDSYSSRAQDRLELAIGSDFVSANDPERIRWWFALARWSLIPLLLLGGYFGYKLSRELYGSPAGLLFLGLWCFSPLLLGLGATICPDAVAAAFGLLGICALRRWLLKPSWTRAAVAGVCLGLLLLTKLTWIIALGLWPLIWCFWAAPIWLTRADKRSLPLPPFRQLMAIVLLALYVLNMGYLFDGTFRPLGKYVFISQLFRGPEVPGNERTPVVESRFAGTWLGAIPVPLPADFVQGVDTQRLDFERGLPSYLRGRWADHGWWYYYLYALAIKEPLGTWCLGAMAVGLTIYEVLKRLRVTGSRMPSLPGALPEGEGSDSSASLFSASWRDEMILLVPIVAILVFVSSQTGFSCHSRYILPALPLLFVWTSKVGRALEKSSHPMPSTQRARGIAAWFRGRRQPAVAAIAILALIWSGGSSLSIYPHSLSYFNELAAILPTPADASYPKPIGTGGNGGILSAIVRTISAGPRNGPRHLLDSNIDLGQDLFYLEEWCESHPEAKPIRVAYFGGYPVDHSKIKSAGAPPTGLVREDIDNKTDPASFGPLPGWYALSVNEIYGRSQQYRYFLNFEPVAMAGYSIYIYHISPE